MPDGDVPGYRPGNILDKEPTVIATAIFAVVNFVVVAGTWTIETATLTAGETALVLLLSLFVRTKSTSNSTAAVLVEKAKAETTVAVKADVDDFLQAAANDESARVADESHERFSDALAAAQDEIAALRAEAAAPPKRVRAAKKAAPKPD